MSHRIKRDVILWGERGTNPETGLPYPQTVIPGPELVTGERGFHVFLFRVTHTDGFRKRFERRLDRVGLEWERVRDDSTSTYEVWGPVDVIQRVSGDDGVISVSLSVDGSVPGYQRPCPFSPRRG